MTVPATRRSVLPDTLDPTRPAAALRSVRRCYRVDRRDISLLRFILEAYEGAATLTTLRPRDGVVSVQIAPGREPLVTDLLAVLAADGDIRMEPWAEPPSATRDEA